MDSACAPDNVHIGPVGVGIGGFLLVASWLVSLPQLVKLWRLRSSAGVQPTTLCILLMYSSSNVASAAATKWRQITTCQKSVPDCLVEQLDLAQIVVSAIVWLSILSMTLALPPHNTRLWLCRGAGALSAVVCLLVAVAVTSIAEPCGDVALGLAQAAAWASSLLAVFALIPQLLETWRRRSAGSLSVVFTLIQAVGCYIVAGNQIFSAHDPWPVWLPTCVAGLMQFSLFSLAVHFGGCRDECAGRRLSDDVEEPPFTESSNESFLGGEPISDKALPEEPNGASGNEN